GANDPEEDEAAQMARLMGFTGFKTTQETHVAGTAGGVCHVVKPRKYRQFMNRPGGFNRSLSPS
ncbi:hypothetical protein CXG81DRAFT_10713, partial [Caulochytrium protostelioides]